MAPNKIKARLPRGLNDRDAAEIAATREMVEKIRQVFERYGFEAVETPAIEYTDVLGKFLPDQDRPNEGVFSFQDDDEQWLSLRYDLTAPLARYVAENFDRLSKPYRSYRYGWVFRNEKPGPGRYRQFLQFDADTVGAPSVAADAEMCMMAADTMEELGIQRGDYVIKVSSRKILDGLRATISKKKPIADAQWLTVMRAIDKLDRLDWQGIEALLGEGRTDDSGDFTRGASLDASSIQQIKDFLFVTTGPGMKHYQPASPSSKNYVDGDEMMSNLDSNLYFSNTDTIVGLHAVIGGTEVGEQALSELERIFGIMISARYGSKRIRFDPSVVRGLEYYTGPVFEADLTFPTQDGTRFGSVGGGGRYDGLIARFRGEPVPATGFSIGVSRLLAALRHLGKAQSKPEAGPVVVTVFDKERIADYQHMVQTLRNAGIRAELYLGSGKMGPQLKYADKRNCPCVVIQGGDEKAKGEIQIKDLIEGAKAAAAIASNQEWRESRPAQFSVPEDKLVEAVREVLARHGLAR